MKNFFSINKGEFQYIDKRKRNYLILSIILLTSVLVIFFTGILLYDSNKSIFSVLAAVASLPAAKIVTLYIVIVPYKSCSKNDFDMINDIVCEKNGRLLCDITITSEQKASFLSFVAIINTHVVIYSNYKKIDVSYVEKYIKDILDANCNYASLKVFTELDAFSKRVQSVSGSETPKKMDERIATKLISYSM